MGRILAIDYGRKRCGIAVTDTLRIAANPLTTVRACDLNAFIKEYTRANEVDFILVGLPTDMRGQASESQRYLIPAMKSLAKALPGIRIEYYDERFTSVLAHKAMLDSGMKKKARQDKDTVDKISAAIILNDYLQSIHSL